MKNITVEEGNPVYDSRDNCNAVICTAENRMIAACPSTIIPNSVTSLGNGCFLGCDGLASVTIPGSVTSLGDECFYVCSNLTSVTLPKSLTTMGRHCFAYCTGLSSIIVPYAVTTVGSDCFSEADYTIYCYPKHYDSLKEVYGERVVLYDDPTAIGNVAAEADSPAVEGCYDLSGRRLSGWQRGLQIIRYSDGTSRKVMVN